MIPAALSHAAASTSRCVTARTVRGPNAFEQHARSRAGRHERGGVGDAEDDDVGLDARRVEHDAGAVGQPLGDPARVARDRPPGARRCARARRVPAAARMPAWRIAPPNMRRYRTRARDAVARPGQHAADRRAEPLRQRHGDQVERRRQLGQRSARWRRRRSTGARRRDSVAMPELARGARRSPPHRPAGRPRRRRGCACSRPDQRGRRIDHVPARLAARRANSAAVNRPPLPTTVNCTPEFAAAAPSRARRRAPRRRRSPRRRGASAAIATWLAIVPLGTKSAASLPSSCGDPLLQRVDRRVLAILVVADLGARPSPRASPATAA